MSKVAVFIDASNLWQVQKVKGQMLDFQKLQSYLKSSLKATELTCYYYTAYPANDARDYSLDSKHKFFTYLSKKLSFTVRKKELKRINTEKGFIEKGNMDVEMTIDAVHYKDAFNTAIFFTGDSDFLALVTYLKSHKKKIFIYSSKNNISNELRTGADGYLDILNIKEDIWKNSLRFRAQK